jgi:hypothetical protein
MYASIIGFALAGLIIVGAGLARFTTQVHTLAVQQAQQVSKLYAKRAEEELADQIGYQYQTDLAASPPAPFEAMPGTTFAQSLANGSTGETAYCPSSNSTGTGGAGACAYQMKWSASIIGSTVAAAAPSTNEQSSNVNADVDEERVSALLTITATSPGGGVVQTTNETVTMRLYNFSPYVSIVSSTFDKSAYAGSWGANKTTENDVAGCTNATTCGTTTAINSFGDCQTGSVNNIGPAAQASWCSDNPTNTSYNHPIASPTDLYPNTSQLSNSSWQNNNANTTP